MSSGDHGCAVGVDQSADEVDGRALCLSWQKRRSALKTMAAAHRRRMSGRCSLHHQADPVTEVAEAVLGGVGGVQPGTQGCVDAEAVQGQGLLEPLCEPVAASRLTPTSSQVMASVRAFLGIAIAVHARAGLMRREAMRWRSWAGGRGHCASCAPGSAG